MSDSLRLTAVLQPRGPAAAVILTDEQVASLGGAKTPQVTYVVHGQSVEGRVGRMGGENLLGMNKAVRAQLGVQAGDEIDIEISLDAAPRSYEAPPALASALDAEPKAKAAWAKLAPSRQKEFARSVSEAKQESTRGRRVAKVIETLTADGG